MILAEGTETCVDCCDWVCPAGGLILGPVTFETVVPPVIEKASLL